MAELFYIYTRPDARGHGIARRLMHQWLKKMAEKLPAGMALLEVRASNVAALKLYEAFGFTMMRRRRHYYPDGEDAFILTRALDA